MLLLSTDVCTAQYLRTDKDNGSNSAGRGHKQQSTKYREENVAAKATAAPEMVTMSAMAVADVVAAARATATATEAEAEAAVRCGGGG
jgi:hypothetical protein